MSTAANYVAMTISNTPGTGNADLGTALSSPDQSFLSAYGAVSTTVDVEWYSDATTTTRLGVERNVVYNGGSPGTLTRGTPETPGSLVNLGAGASVRVVLPASSINAFERQVDAGYVEVQNSAANTQSWSIGNVILTTALNTVNFDSKGWWNTTTKLFQPTRAGKYLIVVKAAIANGTAGVYNGAIVFNGAAYNYGPPTNQSFTTAAWSDIVAFNGSSDYAQAGMYAGTAHSSGSTAGDVIFKALFITD